ncbi:MAG: response regulator [Anaerolineales bacterium]
MEPIAILIVEDEENLARTLSQALRMGSDGQYSVETCPTAEEAVRLLEEHPYHLVISDYLLPGENGLDLVIQVKAENPELHTILITGYGTKDLEAAADKTTEGYLTKPFDMLDLLLMVQKVITPGNGKAGQAIKQQDLEKKNNHRILILEDDYGLRHIFGRALRKSGYTVEEASTIQAARSQLDTADYEIFICDIQIGRERGLDLLAEYQHKFNQTGTHVVICSAYGQYRAQTEEIGVDFFLEKPISLNTLLSLVDGLVAAEKIPQN